MSKEATCSWGVGPNVMITLENDLFILYEDLKHLSSPRGNYEHGYVTKGSMDLTADEALKLASQLVAAANLAKELDKKASKTLCNEDHQDKPATL